MDRLIKIELLGQQYTLRTDAAEDKVRAAVELVEAKLGEYQEATRSNIKLNVAILAALDIANEYLQLKDSCDKLQLELEARSQEMIRAIEAEVGK